MTEIQELPDTGHVTAEALGPDTLMKQLRAKRLEISETVDTLIPVQIFGGKVEGKIIPQVFAKYRLIEREEIEELGRVIRKQTRDQGEQMMRVVVDSLVSACEGFYVQPEGADQPEELKWPDGNHVLTYRDMANYLGYMAAPGHVLQDREAVFYVFGDKEFSVGQHGIAFNRWLNNAGIQIDQEFLGEG